MNASMSLRGRLTLVILLPLMLVALLVGVWAYRDAQQNAADRFDRSLLSTALAISRDIAVSGGDALSQETRDLLRDTSGGAVFYHVYAPDGVFVTGYATPPVPPQTDDPETAKYYDAEYLSGTVRALRLTQQASVDGLSGLFTFTVWQSTTVRDGFVQSRTIPVFSIIAVLVGALIVIVWFGVRRGLAPLLDLEEAIARRSVDDLSPIKRRIPQEVSGIVGRFNNLLGELSASIRAKDAFISDASHQLRNPIAGVIALTDSVAKAKDMEAAQGRIDDLRNAAKDLGQLTNSLLTLERLKAGPNAMQRKTFDAKEVIRETTSSFENTALSKGIRFEVSLPDTPCLLKGDPVMFGQAVLNVLSNAIAHGGDGLSSLSLVMSKDRGSLRVVVEDDGKGIDPKDFEKALGRFSQVGPSAGSGLGLPIADAVFRNHGGTIGLRKTGGFFRVTMEVPLAPDA